ncbi:TPA: hypothetical protein DCW54_03395, partial [Candidatus Dependentiae bacterium]|nr:hypothetical protein [Candidatus Dependentiae bacterium]
MKVTSFLFLWLGVLGGFADLAEAVTPADVLETSLCEPDGAKKIPWFKCHPIILGMGIYETNVLKNYAKYIPFEFEKDEKPATIKLIGELFGWQNGEFKVATSLGQIGTYLTLEQAGTISGMLTASKSLDKLHKALMNFCCSAGCQKDFGFNKGKMKRRFVDVLVQAESEWKDQALFPSHMPLLIFYAFVYQKAKSRAELVDFFKAFLKADPKLKGCEPFGPDNESFLSEPSVLEIEQPGARSWITVQADAAKLAEEKFFGGEGLDYDEEVAAVAVAQNWKNFDIPPRMPAKISISQTKGEYNDCVEDVLYKFLLLLRKHCAPIVQNVLDDKKNASLLECLDNKDLMLKKVGHEQWNHVVIGGHVPYMIYRQVVCDGKCLTRKEQCAVCLPPSSPLVPKDAPKSGLFKAVNSPMLAFLQDGNCTGYEVSSHL